MIAIGKIKRDLPAESDIFKNIVTKCLSMDNFITIVQIYPSK